MSEEKKAIELKDEELKIVSGGNPPVFHCDDWVEDSAHPLNYGSYDGRVCGTCIYTKRPEGPCKLGHAWFSLY